MQRPKTSSRNNKPNSDHMARNPQQRLFYLNEDLQTTQAKTDLLRHTLLSDMNHMRKGQNMNKLQVNKHLLNSKMNRNRNISIQSDHAHQKSHNQDGENYRVKTKMYASSKKNLNQFLNESIQINGIQSWCGQKVIDKRFHKQRQKNCFSENNNKLINKNAQIKNESFIKIKNKIIKNKDYVKGLVFKDMDIDVKNMSSFATKSMSLFPHSYLRVAKGKKQRQSKLRIEKEKNLQQKVIQQPIPQKKLMIIQSSPRAQAKVSYKKLQIQLHQPNIIHKLGNIQGSIITTPQNKQVKSARTKTRYFQDSSMRGKWINYNKKHSKMSKPHQLFTNQPLKKQINKIINLLNQEKQIKTIFKENF